MEIDKQGKNFFKNHIFLLVMTIIFSVSGFFIYESRAAFAVDLNGEVIAYVKNEEIIKEAFDFVEGEVAILYGEDATFKKDVRATKVRGHKDDVIKAPSLANKISKAINVYKKASVVYIDDYQAFVVESETVAKQVLDLIKQPYKVSSEGSKVLDVFFHQAVEIVNKDVLVEEILDSKPVLKALEAKANLASEEVEVVNMASNIKSVSLSQNNSFDVDSLNLDVITILEKNEVLEIDYKEVKESDKTLYKGETKVVQKGEVGKKQLTYNLTLINGENVKTEKVSEKVIIEPIDKLVKVGSKERPVTPTSSASYNGDKSRGAVNAAWVQVNNRAPYVFGGSSPSGFDCSGLTSYVYRQVGISLPHSSAAQANYGVAVSKANLKPGDLVFFRGYSGSGIVHVGIYIGNGQMIHAPSSGRSMAVASIHSSYFSSRYVSARRVA